MIIDGKALAAKRRAELRQRVDGRKLTSGIILATDDPAVLSYVRGKEKAAREVGYDFRIKDLGITADLEAVLTACHEWNEDDAITGYMVQTPLPGGVDRLDAFAVIDPGKDSDGLTPFNLGQLLSGKEDIVPATPKGIMTLLEAYDVPLKGKVAVVIGKSILVGMPVGVLLSHRGATVIQCDSKTPDLADKTRDADIIVSAAGSPGLIRADMVKPGAIVIDVGITKVAGELTGDVDFDAVKEIAGGITPVPGGVGPMTVVSLLENVHRLAMLAG